jgi:hypothetical protein
MPADRRTCWADLEPDLSDFIGAHSGELCRYLPRRIEPGRIGSPSWGVRDS